MHKMIRRGIASLHNAQLCCMFHELMKICLLFAWEHSMIFLVNILTEVAQVFLVSSSIMVCIQVTEKHF